MAVRTVGSIRHTGFGYLQQLEGNSVIEQNNRFILLDKVTLRIVSSWVKSQISEHIFKRSQYIL